MTIRIIAAALALGTAPPSAAAQENTMTVPAVGATVETAADHIAIQELSNLFENTFDEGAIDAHMATWASEICFQSPFRNYDSRESYREWVQGFYDQMSGIGGTRHLITNTVIDIEGDRANQTAYLVILGRAMNDGGPAMMASVPSRTSWSARLKGGASRSAC